MSARLDSNQEPPRYKLGATTIELRAESPLSSLEPRRVSSVGAPTNASGLRADKTIIDQRNGCALADDFGDCFGDSFVEHVGNNLLCGRARDECRDSVSSFELHAIRYFAHAVV